jgi:hypothetical protein
MKKYLPYEMDNGQAATGTSPPAWASQLFQMIQVQNERMVALETQLGQQRETSARTPERSTSPTTGTARDNGTVRQKAKLPELAEFNGKRAEFRPWLTQARAKLTVDKMEETETVRFWYIHSRLRGHALSQISPWVDSVQSTLAMTTEGLIGQLVAAYDDVDAAERASRKLSQLKQEGKPFGTFLAEFDRTLLEAGGLSWADPVKKTFLSNSLSYELRNALVATPTPPTYREYCTLLHTVSTNLEGLRRRKAEDKQPPPASYGYPSPTEDAMDWAPTVQAAPTTTRSQRAQWVSRAILDQRREMGCCLRCGKKGHFIGKCTLLPAVRPRTERRVAAVEITDDEEPLKE